MTTRASTDFRLFLVGQAASVFGSTMTSAALSIIAVAVLHEPASAVSLIVAAGLLPGLIGGPVAGAVLDRVRRPRRVLIGCDLAAALAVAACFAAGIADRLSAAVLAALAVVLGCTQVAVQGLYFSHLRTLGVPDIARARGRLQASEMGAKSVSGAVAGAVVAALGPALLFLLDTITYLASATSLLLLRSPDLREVPSHVGRTLRGDFAEGVRTLSTHPALRAFTLFLLLSGAASAGVTALRANFVLGTLGVPVALFTVPAIAATLLGACGALWAPRAVARAGGPRRALVASMLAASSSGVLLALAGGPIMLAVALLCLGTALPVFFGAVGNLALVALIRDDIGDEYFARVTTLLTSLTTASALIGTVAAGALATVVGVRPALTVAVVLNLGAALLLVVRSSFSGEEHRYPLDPTATGMPAPAAIALEVA